ncbi:hypothetical protein, partial [Leptospira interrogans]|uniref:hypothetical protein n=1 Tax=Leptospira interrogans TaxID=173 RepID=UPI000AB9E7FF
IVCSPSVNNTLFNIEISRSGSLTNKILNIKSLVKGKKFLDIGLVLFFYFQLERYFEETNFLVRSFIFFLTNLFLEGLCFLALFQNLKDRGIFYKKSMDLISC